MYSSVKDLIYWITSTDDMFILVKVKVEPARRLEWANYIIIEPQSVTYSSEQHSSGFEFRVFPSLKSVALRKLECSTYANILPISED